MVRGIAGVKGGVQGLGEHDDRTLGVDLRGVLGGGQEDLLRFGDGPAPGRDVAAEMLDRQRRDPASARAGAPGQERCGPAGLAAQPGGVGRGVEQPALAALLGGQQRRTLERL